MNYNRFEEKVAESNTLIKDLKLLRRKNLKNYNSFSDEYNSIVMSSDYHTIYNYALEKFAYHILLNDYSFFQYLYRKKGSNLELTYSFYQNPRAYISYEDFHIDNFPDCGLSEEAREIYEDFLAEQPVGTSFVNMRYEYRPSNDNYKELVHAASHLHIGFKNNIRIPLDKILSPLMFTIFVIKHVYYNDWCNNLPIIQKRLDHEKTSCLPISKENWTKDDNKELFLT